MASDGLRPSDGSRLPVPGLVNQRLLSVKDIRLIQNTFQIQLPKQLPENRPQVVLAGGVAGLLVAIRFCEAYASAHGSEVDRHLERYRRTATGGRLNRFSQGLAVADQLLEMTTLARI